MEDKKPWRKILYEEQAYADNYVDKSFLDELKKNLNVRHYKFSSLVCESCVISQQLASVCLLVSLFLYMEAQWLSPLSLWAVSSSLTVLGYACHFGLVCVSSGVRTACVSLSQDLRTCLLFQGYSGALSPILVSLTETISTDTIYAMTALMLVANLLCRNYLSKDDQVPGALSLNAAIFASVCLASRLHTALHAFATVTVAFELFALWPVLCRKVKELSTNMNVLLTFVVTVVSAITLFVASPVGATLYVCLVVYVTFIAPAWFVYLQPLKDNIHGPWDEAIVNTMSS